MGDFYELFGTDAEVASRELGIALTSRAKGTDAMPMAGVPVKSMEPYLMRLVRAGHKVAVCEQMGDPRTTKGIVDRGIVRIVTAGTITEEDELDARTSNYLASVFVDGGRAAVAWIDLSTGRAAATELEASGWATSSRGSLRPRCCSARSCRAPRPIWRSTSSASSGRA